jgi:hypothetical protein
MTTPDHSFDSIAVTTPVFLPGAFLGRKGLVRNMVWRLQRGELLSLYGGPKLGKTSLLLHLAWHLNKASSSPSASEPAAEYFDLAVQTECARLRSRSPKDDTIVLLDNCDRVSEGDGLSLTEFQGIHSKATVFSGGRAWREYQCGGGDGPTVKPIPLSVFLEHEARQMVNQQLSPVQQTLVLTYGGTHPFLLKILQAELVGAGSDVRSELAIERVKKWLIPFFEHCLAQLRDPLEHQVLAYLIQIGKPVNPKDVERAIGCSNIKPIANTLCHVGLIGRWIRDEEATLSVNSLLLSEWYRESRNS